MGLTACGGGGSTDDNKEQATAMNIIQNYADGSSDTLTIQTYRDAGVQGVTEDNVDELNALVLTLEAEDVDTVEEINALTETLGINIVPIAKAQTVTLDEDSSQAIILIGTDAEGDTLSYIVVTQPTHGTLSGTAPSLTYTPVSNYSGIDAFTFKVNDGKSDSATVNVNLTVNAINDAPVANAQVVTLNEDTTKNITLSGSDIDGDTLTYSVVSEPTHGTLSGRVPNLIYTPMANYNGADEFTFKSNDRTVDSATVKVSMNILSVNDTPIVDAGVDKTVTVNQSIRLQAIASDVEGSESLAYVWRIGDKVIAQIPVFDYAPTSTGAKVLTVTVTDSQGLSATDNMLLMVVDTPNIAPIANTQTLTFEEDSSENVITLTADDADGDSLTYTIVSNPTHGILSGTVPNLSYTPTADYFGDDSFSFKVNDGTVDSATVTVSITIAGVNDAPVMQKDNLAVSFMEHNVSLNNAPNATYGIDMDKDGDKDFLVASEGEPLIWYENDGSQNFIEHNISTSISEGWSVKAVDIDLDSDLDILLASNSNALAWYENDGSQNFTEHNISTTESSSWWVDYGDVDKDGDMDILSSDVDGKAKWWENDGSQNFTEHNLTDVGYWSYIVMDDLDADDANDLIVTEHRSGSIVWYQNDGSQNFVEHNITSTLNQVFSVYIVDIDNDGDKDIVGTGWERTSLYVNDGNQNFVEHNVSMGDGYVGTYVADMDDDGDMDIVNSRAWFENTGELTFVQHELSEFAPYFDAIDLDSDGDIDILSPYYFSNAIVWQENLGLTAMYLKEGNTTVGTMVATDIDGDTLTYSITGVDSDKFDINVTTGELIFKVAPDYDNPIDEDEDNVYELNVAVTDGSESDDLDIRVIVEDEAEDDEE
jgi:hypothetical protein